jgi:thiamine biosynthesis lipoprotein
VSDHELATARLQALGTTALVQVSNPEALEPARILLERELDAIDRAASRFRPDSELERVNAAAGRFVRISPLLHEAIAVALAGAERTGGALDPTLGSAIRLAGYERDYAQLEHVGVDEPLGQGPPTLRLSRSGGWREVRLSDEPPQVLVPAGMALDLGASAKALAADRAVSAILSAVGGGVLVSLGGDIAVAGHAPERGWLIHVTDDHRSAPDAPGQTVTIRAGALATSSITTRRWRHAGRVMHHILDPATGQPVSGPWRTASVAAVSCVQANEAATAAIVLGEEAPRWLEEQRLPARLVARDGRVLVLGGWPSEKAAAKRKQGGHRRPSADSS